MNTSTKILIFIAVMVLFGSLAFIIVKQNEMAQKQKNIETSIVEQKQLQDNIIRAQSQYATKADIDQMAKDNGVNLQVIRDDLAKMGASVEGINTVVINSKGQNVTNVVSTSVTPGGPDAGPAIVKCPNGTSVPCPDPYGYARNTQDLKLEEQFGSNKIPIGQVGFSAWRPAPWDLIVYSRQYDLTTVIGKDDSGREYTYNKFQIISNGKHYDVKIDNSKFLQEYPEPKFSFWNPRLFLSVTSSVQGSLPIQGEFSPGLMLGVMSYGKFLSTPDFSILQVGMSYGAVNKLGLVTINPINYNIGKSLLPKLMSNTYVGPSLQIGTNGGVFFGLGLTVGL